MNSPPAPAPARQNKAVVIAIGTAIAALAIAVAALIVGISNLRRPATSSIPVAAPSPPLPKPIDSTAANQSLCVAIAPLMAESDRISKALSSLAPSSSPAWNAGTPRFVSDEKNLLGRLQPIIDSHPDVSSYFQRTLQRYVDDRKNLVADLEAGPWQPYDQNIWDDSLGAYNGPLETCWSLGIKW
ncbi:hypothetical protein OK015_28625 (plasmid) [Mycobacterium sp. Aquia_216]|uniref:hypothetical protein n=1 Tax=Mycobacterium sp. Aquia_216 TaxID=2991729 RepID=UPI00227BE2EC|nr:hypothetical protein [Mycobacterium sp. Aquia_216]WAJ48015.1 hypothetical protein OK015_28625 [Mycobacterium sp. Aquia_216]